MSKNFKAIVNLKEFAHPSPKNINNVVFLQKGRTNTWIFVMGGDPTFFGSVAETTNLYLQHCKKQKIKHWKEEMEHRIFNNTTQDLIPIS